MDWLNQYQNATVATSPGFSTLPRGQHEGEVIKITYNPRSKAPFALDQPEIEFTVKILSGPAADQHGSLKIFPTQPSKTLPPKEGKPAFTIPAGMSQLKQVFEAYSLPMGNPPSPEELKAALRGMKGRGMQVFATGKGNSIIFNRPIEFAADMSTEEVLDTDDLMGGSNLSPVETALVSAVTETTPVASADDPEEIFDLGL